MQWANAHIGSITSGAIHQVVASVQLRWPLNPMEAICCDQQRHPKTGIWKLVADSLLPQQHQWIHR